MDKDLKFLHDALSYVHQTCDGLKNNSAEETYEHLNQFLQYADADDALKEFAKRVIHRVIDLRISLNYFVD